MSTRSSVLRYSLPLLTVLIAATLTNLLHAQVEHSRFLFYLIAVFLTSWRAGVGPGLVSVMLSTIVTGYFYLPPLSTPQSYEPQRLVPEVAFGVLAALMCAVYAAGRHTMEERATLLVQVEAERLRLQAVLDQMQAGVMIAEAPSGRVVLGNQLAESLRGTLVWPDGSEKHEEISAWLSDGSPCAADDWPLSRAISKGEVISGEVIRIHGSDGSQKWLYVNSGPIRDLSGQIVAGVATFSDITDHRRAEEALRESEERLRLAMASAGIAIFDWNLRTHQVRWSDNSSDILGVDRKLYDLTDHGFERLIHRDDRDSFVKELSDSIRNRRTSCQQFRVVGSDGQARWIEGHGLVVSDDRGNAVRMLGTCINVTDRHVADEKLKRLATAVEQAAETIVITDTQGSIEYVNPAFERTSGYSISEVIGQNPRLLKSGNQDDIFYQDLWRTLLSGQSWIGRFSNRRKDGSIFEEEATITPVRDQLGNIVNYVAVKRDVTKEVVLENQLLQSQKMDAIGRLAGGIAHDFNNLLTAIIGYSQIAMLNCDSRERVLKDLQEILKAGQSAASLTSQLLAFSRKQVVQPQVLGLNALVTDLQKMLRRLIGEDIDLTAVLDLELDSVKADLGQLQQVIVNLVVNARDAMPNGGKVTIETANVELDSEYASRHIGVKAGAYVMLAVSDNGVGMDEATRLRIFEPFFTTKERGQGTGLGLSTVYGIVKQSGGNIWVYSEPGRGTTFKVYLPRTDEVRDPEEGNVSSQIPTGTETLMLVEDDPAVRHLAARILRAQGYKVIEAMDGADAVSILEEESDEQVDLLVTDVVMPQIGGSELARLLSLSRPGLPVLYVSGYPDGSITRHGILDPGIPFLQKPFSPHDLGRKVRDLLDSAQSKSAPSDIGPRRRVPDIESMGHQSQTR
jgi:two-component system cell cycle sensor histidine kinase/response regulator CckA